MRSVALFTLQIRLTGWVALAHTVLRGLPRTSSSSTRMPRVTWNIALGVAIGLGIAAQASAQNLAPSGSGLLVLDLAGTPMISSYTQYNASFVATNSLSTVTFEFRNDPGFFGFDAASVVDATTAGGNLLLNPGFENGAPTVSGGTVPNWTAFEQAGLISLGFPALGIEAASGTDGLSAFSGGFYWNDGATGGYDGISQTITTTVGDTYDISFELSEVNSNGVPTPGDAYEQTCTNGDPAGTDCNGIDMVVYASGAQPTPAPEPASIVVLLSGLFGIRLIRQRKG
jgi:hypothetical protein